MGEKGQHLPLEISQCFKVKLSAKLMLQSCLCHGEGQLQSPLRLSPCAFYRHIPPSLPVICLNLSACAVGNTALSAAVCLVCFVGLHSGHLLLFESRQVPTPARSEAVPKHGLVRCRCVCGPLENEILLRREGEPRAHSAPVPSGNVCVTRKRRFHRAHEHFSPLCAEKCSAEAGSWLSRGDVSATFLFRVSRVESGSELGQSPGSRAQSALSVRIVHGPLWDPRARFGHFDPRRENTKCGPSESQQRSRSGG